jgi:hypothetical protein
MPLEALREAKFSHKSDVFAFGVLLWEILSLGQTPWGVFGVPEFSQALAKGERLGFPPRLERSSTDGDVDTATKIYSVALRCWKEVPTKRPHFHQLEAEFAIHHTVMATAAAAAAGSELGRASGIGGSAARADGCQTKADENADWKITALDANGYAAHSDAEQLPALDGDGYVADDGFSPRPVLGADGYVEDTAVLEAKSVTVLLGGASNSGGSNSNRHLAGNDASLALLPREMPPYATAQSSTEAGDGAIGSSGDVAGTNEARLPTLRMRPGLGEHPETPPSATRKPPISNGSDDANTAEGDSERLGLSTNSQNSATTLVDDDASSTFPRKAIVARSARKPSLYLGFEEGDSSGVGLHDDETRL